MCCNGFVDETLVPVVCHCLVAAIYKEQVVSCKQLDEPLDEGKFVFECMLAKLVICDERFHSKYCTKLMLT